MDAKNLNSLSIQIGISQNKLKFFFKNLRLKDFLTTKKHIKNIKSYRKFTLADKIILEKAFRLNNIPNRNAFDVL